MAALAPESTLLDTAERNGGAGDHSCVDPDHPNFQRLGNPPDPTDVSRVEIPCESDIGIVRQLEHLLFGFELDQSCDGSKGLFFAEER